MNSRIPSKKELTDHEFDRLGDESLGSTPPVGIIFENGEFRLTTSSKCSLSPQSRVLALTEILNECLFALTEQFQGGFISETLNQEPIFLDLQAPDELGNSRSVWIGSRGQRHISDERWVDFLNDLQTEFLELRLELISDKLPHAPPNIYKEDAEQALKACLEEIKESSQAIGVDKINSTWWINLCQAQLKIDSLKEELTRMRKKIERMKSELNKRSMPKKSKNRNVSDQNFVRSSHMRHNDQHEIDQMLSLMILKLFNGRFRSRSHR